MAATNKAGYKYFHDPDRFTWAPVLKSLYPEIKQEWNSYPRHHVISYGNYNNGPRLEKGNSNWDLVPLMKRDRVLDEMREFFPVTMSLIDRLPVYENLSFSIFYPGTELVPHRGWTDSIVRVHLAIETSEQAALVCGGESMSLSNGEMLIFEDGEEHYAYNKSDKERIVMIFDVLKTDLEGTVIG